MSRRRLAALAAPASLALATGAAVFVAVAPSRAAVPATAGPVAAPVAAAAPVWRSADALVRARARAREKSRAERRVAERRRLQAAIAWRDSRALGTTGAGRLVNGVRLPREGVHFLTWHPVRWTKPNAASRRYGTDRLVRMILRVAREHAAANSGAPRITVGDLARPGGGPFDARFGGLGQFGNPGTRGHVSHQNGLDVDVYYPRRDRRERAPDSLRDIDRRLAQDLVDRFVAAGAQFVFVGPRTGLTGPPGIVQPLERHDDHLHVRLPPG